MTKKDYSKPLVNIGSIGHNNVDGLALIDAINKTLPKKKSIFKDYDKTPKENGITINTAYLKKRKKR